MVHPHTLHITAMTATEPVQPTAVLLMQYGEPETLDDIRDYLKLHFYGQEPDAATVTAMREQYLRVWGGPPPANFPQRIAAALDGELQRRVGGRMRAYHAARHWRPFIADVLARIEADGFRRVLALTIYPQASLIENQSYRRALDEGCAQLAEPIEVSFIESWHVLTAFIEAYARRVCAAFDALPAESRDSYRLVFCAHSMPQAAQARDDPYQPQLMQSAQAVAGRAGVDDWVFAYRNASTSGVWLEPDIRQVIERAAGQGVRGLVVVSIGMVYDDVETMDALRFGAQAAADSAGIDLRLVDTPGADPDLIRGLAELAAARTG